MFAVFFHSKKLSTLHLLISGLYILCFPRPILLVLNGYIYFLLNNSGHFWNTRIYICNTSNMIRKIGFLLIINLFFFLHFSLDCNENVVLLIHSLKRILLLKKKLRNIAPCLFIDVHDSLVLFEFCNQSPLFQHQLSKSNKYILHKEN